MSVGSEGKHSPGPWTVEKRPPYDRDPWILDDCGLPVGAAYGANLNVRAANARLIAAAPDLLEAAARGVMALEANGAPNCEAAKELRLAIMKAREVNP